MTLPSAQQHGLPGTRDPVRDMKLGTGPFPLDTSELISLLKQGQTCPIYQGPREHGGKSLFSVILRLQGYLVATEPSLPEQLFLQHQTP